MNISKTTHQITPLKLEFCGEELNLEIKLNAITGKFVDSVRDDDEFLIKSLVESIHSWDATLDGEKEIPVTVEGVKELPITLRQFIWQEIVEKRGDLKKTKESQSQSTSSAAGD